MTQAQSVPSPLELSLFAPVDGVIVPLEDLPDAVFAEKMLGDGVSIDPTGCRVLAPCAGVITQLHRARHALTIRTDDGVSILVHVGLDTVTLDGRGFTALVKEGDRVTVRQPLLDFDLDVIAQGALSAQVEIVVTEGGENLSFKRRDGDVKAGDDEIVRISAGPASSKKQIAKAGADGTVTLGATIVNPHGMHARPAARLSKVAKSFEADVSLSYNGQTVSATSVADIMGLDLDNGSVLQILARGTDAHAAAQAVRDAIAGGLGEQPGTAAATPAVTKLVSQEEGVIGGVPASPGLAIGTIVIRSLDVPPFEERSNNAVAEKAAITKGVAATLSALEAEERDFLAAGEAEKAQIFAAHRELLQDPGIFTDAEAGVAAGASAARAWQDAMASRIEKLGSLKSPLLRQRATDMKDVSRRVLFSILGKPLPKLELTRDSVLVCDDLTPSTAAGLKADSIGAIVSELGGATSHAAIIARSMGVPYVAGLGSEISALTEGARVIVDGSTGAIRVAPDDSALAQARAGIAQLRETDIVQQKKAHEKAQTIDGFHVEVAANIGNAKDSAQGVEKGCDGVGLLRSEFLFMNRREAPTEEEQRAEYEEIARTLGPDRSLVIRTLDVGGDKPLAYMPLEEEENPFLGIRGLRLSLKFPDLFRSQIRAALAAAKHTKLNLMFPMVSQPHEFQTAKRYVLEEMDALGVSPPNVAIGVMVEVPSAALNARWLAKDADFFSIGTNDLTQYTLAMDRGHSELSKQADAFDPSVLRLIQMTVEAAHAEGKWVGVCGGLSAEPLAAPLLVGLNLDELSVPAPVIPELKARIRTLRHDACQAVAEGALALPSASAVRALLSSFLENQPGA